MEQSLSSTIQKKIQLNKKVSLYAFLATFCAAICFAAMAVLVHELKGKLSPAEVVTWRSIIVFISLIPFTYKSIPTLLSKSALNVWARSVFGVGGILCYFYILQEMNAANAAMIYLLSPVFVLILSKFFLKEQLSKKQIFGILLILGTEIFIKTSNFVPIENKLFLIGIAGAVAGSLAMFFLKKSTFSFSSSVILTCFSFCTLIIAGLIQFDQWQNINSEVFIYILAIGFFTLIGHLLFTFAMKYLPASIPNFALKTIMIWIAILNFSIFQIIPTWQECTSYLILLTGVFLLKK